ncbi:uncharacterized [Tachysurus ichikawai]
MVRVLVLMLLSFVYKKSLDEGNLLHQSHSEAHSASIPLSEFEDSSEKTAHVLRPLIGHACGPRGDILARSGAWSRAFNSC